MTTSPITVTGLKQLEETLAKLKQERPQVIEEIRKARANGDLKENADYHANRERQGLIEARIAEIKAKLANSTVIDPTQLMSRQSAGKVVFGATVHLINSKTNESVIYQIVGADEANPKEAKISFLSPIASALIGKEVEDEVQVQTPAGVQQFEILKIEYI